MAQYDNQNSLKVNKMGKVNMDSSYFHSCYIVNHCEKGQIQKRPTKSSKNQSVFDFRV